MNTKIHFKEYTTCSMEKKSVPVAFMVLKYGQQINVMKNIQAFAMFRICKDLKLHKWLAYLFRIKKGDNCKLS